MEPQAFEKIRRKIYIKDTEIAGMYDMEDTIGAGHFAKVKLARHVFTGSKVAIKIIDKTKLDDVAKSHLHKEVNCMKLVQHPNVVKLYHVIDTQSKLYLILEYGDGGDLYDHIMTHQAKAKGMAEEKARHYFQQIVSAIDYCHKLHVVHRDLKPENVILFEKGHNGHGLAKLTDFGFSNIYIPEKKLETSCGSLAYSAPEILLGGSYDPTAVDIWSLGVILYMMVCGCGPFNHTSDTETLTNILDCKYDLPDTLSEGCKSLIKLMLVSKPGERASLKKILDHEWLCQGAAIAIPHKPLISDLDLSVDMHLDILQAMPKGWTKEEVETSLKQDQYGNITATYYLLAEVILKKRLNFTHHMKVATCHSSPLDTRRSNSTSEVESRSRTSSNASSESSSNSVTLSLPTQTTMTLLASTNEQLSFNLIETDTFPTTSDLTNELSHSDEGLSDVDDTGTGLGTGVGEFKIEPLSGRSKRLSYPFPSRTKSQSSPSLLPINEPITEENESENDDEGNPRHTSNTKRFAMRRNTFNTGTGTSTTCRLSPIHSRRSSYSSSDDDDSHLLMGKKILSHSTSSPSSSAHVQTPNNSTTQQQQQTDTNSNNSKSCKSATETPLLPNNSNEFTTKQTESSSLSHNKFTKILLNNNSSNNKPSKATSMDNLSAKMLSLLMEDLEQVSTKTSPNVMLRNLVNNAYGRHLSDTNLTTYSMQLQMALATEKMKKTPSSIHHKQQSKSSSDTNLIKRFCQKKQHNIVPADLFKTKEMIFKYLKRTHHRCTSTKSVSLSATIQEEDPVMSHHQGSGNNLPLSETFSDIKEVGDEENLLTQQQPDSESCKKQSDVSSKYHCDVNDENDLFRNHHLQQQQQCSALSKSHNNSIASKDQYDGDCDEDEILTTDSERQPTTVECSITGVTTTTAIVSAALNGGGGGTVGNNSVCCSLV